MSSSLVTVAPGPLSIRRLADSWHAHERAEEFTRALLTFLASQESASTRRSYAYAICEFWHWYESVFQRSPSPDQVQRMDVAAYVEWLKTRKGSLDEAKLAGEPNGQLLAAIVRAVRSFGRAEGCTIDDIRLMLDSDETLASEQLADATLAPILSDLARNRYLARSPTIEDIRSGKAGLEFDGVDIARAQLDFELDPHIFYYRANERTPGDGRRASTVAARLSVLSAFWEYMSETGENVGARAPLLLHNIWRQPLKRATRLAPGAKLASRTLKTTTLDIFLRLLATTFHRSHGKPGALDAAKAALLGKDVPGQAVALPSAFDLRDRALLLFLFYTGCRANELKTLRRQDLDEREPIVSVTGKGGKTRTFRVPEPAVAAIREQQTRLLAMSIRPGRGAHQLPRASKLTRPDAPLFPSLKLWGRNTKLVAVEMTGLGRPAISMMMRRRAIQAGILYGTKDFAKVHVHGLRHLAAKQALERGVPLPVVQAVLGHSSLATTGQYVEEHDPSRLCLDATVAKSRPEDGPPVQQYVVDLLKDEIEPSPTLERELEQLDHDSTSTTE